jgi:hypothetical protein
MVTRECDSPDTPEARRVVSMSPATHGWIVSLSCGHSRHLPEPPTVRVYCWTCAEHSHNPLRSK